MKTSVLMTILLTLTCFSIETYAEKAEIVTGEMTVSQALKRSADIDARLFLLKGRYKKKLSIIDGGNISDMEGKIIATIMISIETKIESVEDTLDSFETQESLVNLNYNELSREIKDISVLIDEL